MSEFVPLWMFPIMMVSVFAGFPVAFCLMGIALIFGIFGFGSGLPPFLIRRVYGMADNYVLAAVPLFVFMGTMLERSGIAKRLFEAISIWTGRLRGGLAISTILMCTIIAACTGIIGASEVMVGVMAIPAMLKRNYNHPLICGTICAGGALGTLIPPSVVTVVYGPAAGISVGRLLISTILPGLLLSGIYIGYIAIRSYLTPDFAPPVAAEETRMPFREKMKITATGMLPSLALIFSVMGSIVLGLSPPTEAAALGAFGSILLTVAYRNFSLQAMKETVIQTLRITSMMMTILVGGSIFSGVFLGMGGGDATEKILSAMHLGPWGVMILFLVIVYLAGFILDWASILLVFVPIFSPIVAKLGIDPVWFGTLFIMMIQTSYLTPPMSPAIFYLKGIAPPEITTNEIFKGIVSYMFLQLIGIAVVTAFPSIALWLPEMLIRW
ncbi:MAG TPA: TRAP transporter large permease subunit [Thermodesulfobacteriota bacterium]|nr:TRAP transporter large permease subunit [Thermodesulfobacteriota bacterium]